MDSILYVYKKRNISVARNRDVRKFCFIVVYLNFQDLILLRRKKPG